VFILWPDIHIELMMGGPVGTVLTYFFCFMTQLGAEAFYLIVIPYVLWGRDKKLGIEIAIMNVTSGLVNSSLKNILKVPRPPKKDQAPCAATSSYSFPSGHAQGSSSFWTYVSVTVKNKWLLIVGIVLTGLISYSRIFLGVHRWNEVIAGLAIGIAIALVFYDLRNPTRKLLAKMTHAQRMTLAIIIPLVMFLATRTLEFAQLSGFLMGVLVGAELEATNLDMPDTKDGVVRWKRLMIGYTICGLFLFGLGHFGSNIPGWQFIVYTLSGMGVTFFAPLAFSRIEHWDRSNKISE
jgi:membrane-associated phospholipid phosphatase